MVPSGSVASPVRIMFWPCVACVGGVVVRRAVGCWLPLVSSLLLPPFEGVDGPGVGVSVGLLLEPDVPEPDEPEEPELESPEEWGAVGVGVTVLSVGGGFG